MSRSRKAPKFKLVDQVYRSKNAPGVNWGSNIFVVARRGKKELWKTKGSSIRYRLCAAEYIPGELQLVQDAERHYRSYEPCLSTRLQEGGRMSRKTFKTHAAAINEFFGCEVAEHLDPNKTLLIEE